MNLNMLLIVLGLTSAALAALCIQMRHKLGTLKRVAHEWRRKATTHYLTGLPNFEAFLSLAKPQLARALRHGSPWTLLFMDLDQFGRVNKMCGEMAGDQCLIALAKAFQMRDCDICHPYGDNFVVTLDADLLGASTMVTRMVTHGLDRVNQLQLSLSGTEKPYPYLPIPGMSIGAVIVEHTEPECALYTICYWSEAEDRFIPCSTPKQIQLNMSVGHASELLYSALDDARSLGLHQAKCVKGRR